MAKWVPKGDYQPAMDMYMGDRSTFQSIGDPAFDYPKQIQGVQNSPTRSQKAGRFKTPGLHLARQIRHDVTTVFSTESPNTAMRTSGSTAMRTHSGSDIVKKTVC